MSTDSATIVRTIRDQITPGVLMSLGARKFRHGNGPFIEGAQPRPYLLFDANILPMTATGRGAAARVMQVVVSLNARNLYDIRVTHTKRGDKYGIEPHVVHYEAEDVSAESLAQTMLSLDYDGETVTNPRYATT